MENLSLNIVDGQMHIEGYPDGIKVIALEGKIAQRAADLMLHLHDLSFSNECLTALEGQTPSASTLQRALWHAAIVHCMKCFGSSECRFSLDAKKVLKGEPAEALDVYAYFKDLRDKHIVHDENTHHQAQAGAILNDGSKSFVVEKIVVPVITAATHDVPQYGQLRLLIAAALKWVEGEFDSVAGKLTKDLEVVPHAELLARPGLSFKKPSVEDIDKARPRS